MARRGIGRMRAGGDLIAGPALLLMFAGQSNAARRPNQATTTYPRALRTFGGAGEAIDRTDAITVTASLPASYFESTQAFSEFGVNAEGLAPGYSYVATTYRNILNFNPAIGARHWRELMPGTGSWANMQQAMIQGKSMLNARLATSIDVVAVIVHGESDADQVAPGGGAEAGADITQAEYLNIITDWTAGIQKNTKWCFADSSKTVTIAGMQPMTVAGAAMRNIHNAMLQAATSVTGYNVIGPMYWCAAETDGVHVTGASNDQRGEYIAYRIADIGAGSALPVYMTSASRVGATVTVQCHTISGNLVIDTTNVPETTTSFAHTKNGFEWVKDSDGTFVNVTNVSVAGTTITLTLAADPGGSGKVRYAQMTWPGGNQAVSGSASKLARGNIRDSGTRTSAIDGSTLYNWMCHQSIASN